MPARAQACLITVCTFCLSLLVVVWNTSFSFTPALARMPSAPFIQPAASSTWLALAMLNSGIAAVPRKRGGLFSTLAVITAFGPRMASCRPWRSTSRLKAVRTALSENAGCLDLALPRSPSTSVHGSEALSTIISMSPPVERSTRPLPAPSSRLRMSCSTTRVQARSYSPVCSTARAALTESPPPLISSASKWGWFAT